MAVIALGLVSTQSSLLQTQGAHARIDRPDVKFLDVFDGFPTLTDLADEVM